MAFLTASAQHDVYSMGSAYSHPGSGQDPGPKGQDQSREIDQNLLYSTYEQQRDKHWAHHDKMMEDLKVGKIKLDSNTHSQPSRKPKVLSLIHI